MKKVLKKILILILIFLTINCFIFANKSYAGDILETIGEGLVGIFAYPFQLLARWIGAAINLVTAGVAYIDGSNSASVNKTILTPFNILFNDVKLVDINVFDLQDADSTIVGQIRTGVATWYYVLRMIACAILLAILVYVGIRMALTTIASDKARYNKMLVDWVASIAIIFVLHYIIIFTFNVNTALVNTMKAVAGSTDISDAVEKIGQDAYKFGPSGIGAAAVYAILVIQTIGLLISYINRMLKVSFLIVISPLITLTYSIDKMGDGKAQALGTWLKEFVFTVLIQPFHCVIYIIMASTAINLLTNPNTDTGLAEAILAIICIRFVQEAEKIVRKIFHFEDDNSKTSVAAGMAMSAMALSQSRNIGRSLKNGVTGAKNLATRGANLVNHAKTDAMVIGAMLSGGNKSEVKQARTDANGNEVKDANGNTVMDVVGTRNKTYAELKDEAMAKQVQKKADKLGKKVYGKLAGDAAYSDYKSTMSRDKLNDKDRAKYDSLKNSGMSHTLAMATLRKEKLEDEKLRKDERDRPIITGVRRARATAKAIGQLDTIKDLKNAASAYTSVASGVLMGVSLFGNGKGFSDSVMAGAATYGVTKELLSNSNKTLVNNTLQSVSALSGKNPEEKENALRKVIQSDGTDYQDGSEMMKDLISEIQNQLSKLGMDGGSTKKYANKIHKELRSNALKGNNIRPSDIVKNNIEQYNSLGKSQINMNSNLAGINNATMLMSDLENEKIIYNSYEQSQAAGMSAESFIAETMGAYRAFNKSSYSIVDNEFTDNARIDLDDSTGKAELDKTVNEINDNFKNFEKDIADSTVAMQMKMQKSLSEDVSREILAEVKKDISKELDKQLREIQKAAEKGDQVELSRLKSQIETEFRNAETAQKSFEAEQKKIDAGTSGYTDYKMKEKEKEIMSNLYEVKAKNQALDYVKSKMKTK